jgi:guanylate kinase
LEELERRLRHRHTDSEDQIAKRLLHARKEMEQRPHYDYAVTNDTVPEAVEAICAILRAEHCRIRSGKNDG